VHVVVRQLTDIDDSLVQDLDAIRGNRAKCKFRLRWNTELSHREHFQGRFERTSNTISDWHSTARQGKNKGVAGRDGG
jgi:hypothetical protein